MAIGEVAQLAAGPGYHGQKDRWAACAVGSSLILMSSVRGAGRASFHALGAAWRPMRSLSIPVELDGRNARTPGGRRPGWWLRLRSRWLGSLAGPELQVLRGCGQGGGRWQEYGRAWNIKHGQII
ncbi:MAG: hypothetical protein WBN94_06380 [Methanothrix sp.]